MSTKAKQPGHVYMLAQYAFDYGISNGHTLQCFIRLNIGHGELN